MSDSGKIDDLDTRIFGYIVDEFKDGKMTERFERAESIVPSVEPEPACQHENVRRCVLPAEQRESFHKPFMYICRACHRRLYGRGEEHDHVRCVLPPIDGTARCEVHTDHHREEAEGRRLRFRTDGKCGLCGRDAVPGKARCEKHDSSMGILRCSYCRERGHNRMTCQQLKAGIVIEDVICRCCKRPSVHSERLSAVREANDKVLLRLADIGLALKLITVTTVDEAMTAVLKEMETK